MSTVDGFWETWAAANDSSERAQVAFIAGWDAAFRYWGKTTEGEDA